MAKHWLLLTLALGWSSAMSFAGLGSFHDHALANPLLYGRAVPPPLCNSTEISTMNMGSCVCREQQFGCSSPPMNCSVCPNSKGEFLTAFKNVTTCLGGCTDREASCQGCGLWFHSLCDCLKNPQWCNKTSGPIKKDTGPIWVLLSQPGAKENLTTTNERVSGILDTYEKPKFFDEGWEFSQSCYKPQEQALAMNSVRVRTHEQIHTHICKRNDAMYNFLGAENPNHYNSEDLTLVSNYPNNDGKGTDILCLVVKNGDPVKNFASALGQLFAKYPNTCQQRIGQAILQDKYKNTWACATNTTNGPLGLFCGK
ncbi:hypothetical protein LTR84_005535 [Exophiala bonariae]|uniref:Uncharacterized protein n=1 Tax=Exophiala bonariae TaxID=1690606 RepID=A0AAV9N7H0_9EURO|nr:hypothetical protein LTR84_005535 [Exophiala bonariae]